MELLCLRTGYKGLFQLVPYANQKKTKSGRKVFWGSILGLSKLERAAAMLRLTNSQHTLQAPICCCGSPANRGLVTCYPKRKGESRTAVRIGVARCETCWDNLPPGSQPSPLQATESRRRCGQPQKCFLVRLTYTSRRMSTEVYPHA